MKTLELLKKILSYDDLETLSYFIFKIIPELEAEEDFDQKNEWHSMDVWHHTLTAVSSCDKVFEDRLIMLLHDIGKPHSYQDDGNKRHFNNHAEKSAEISIPILMRLGFDEEKIIELSSLIKDHATRIDVDKITLDNIEYYKRLLKIQICDGSAYEPNHSKQILELLSKQEEEIKEKENKLTWKKTKHM